jgi:hypothetical protein
VTERAKARQGFGFVFVCGDEFKEAHDFQNLPYAIGGTDQFHAAALPVERNIGSEDRGDAGAVDLFEVSQVEEELPRTVGSQLSEMTVQDIRVCADRRLSLKTHDGDIASGSG